MLPLDDTQTVNPDISYTNELGHANSLLEICRQSRYFDPLCHVYFLCFSLGSQEFVLFGPWAPAMAERNVRACYAFVGGLDEANGAEVSVVQIEKTSWNPCCFGYFEAVGMVVVALVDPGADLLAGVAGGISRGA
jgi:hypothetical protein